MKKQIENKKGKTMKLTAKNQELLVKIYMYIFNEFAASTKDIENQFSITKAKTLKFCKYLWDSDLIAGELAEIDQDGYTTGRVGLEYGEEVGMMYIWQCWNTYDTDSTEEAEKRITDFLEHATRN